MARIRKSLEGHEAINWLETVQQHEVDAEVADEIEAALDGELEHAENKGGSGAVTIKRAAEPFQYGSAGSRTNSVFRMPTAAPGDTSLRPGMGGALQRHGPVGVRRAAQQGSARSEANALSHARGAISQLGNGRKK